MFPPFPANYASDGDGNAAPDFGGTVAAKSFAFTFGTTAGATAFTLPAGATIIGFDLVVNDVFNNSPTLSVGHTGSATYYLNAASVLGTAGPVYSTSWVTKSKWYTKLTSPEPITLTVGGTPSAGTGVLTCRYVMQ